LASILAIDPGTNCGWALDLDGIVLSGVWNLKGGRYEGGGMRFIRLRKYLAETCFSSNVNQIYFEEVRRHLGTDAAHIYGGIIATITAFAEQNQIPYEGIPVATVKKYATGKGNADKKMMVEAACKRWPDQFIQDDNQADALWILATGISQMEGAKK